MKYIIFLLMISLVNAEVFLSDTLFQMSMANITNTSLYDGVDSFTLVYGVNVSILNSTELNNNNSQSNQINNINQSLTLTISELLLFLALESANNDTQSNQLDNLNDSLTTLITTQSNDNTTQSNQISNLNKSILWINISGNAVYNNNVGIGITPTDKLEVNGSVKIFENLTIGERIYLTSDNISAKQHFIGIGYSPIDSIADEAFMFVDVEEVPDGEVISMVVYSPNDNITNLRIVDAKQVGRNNSVSYMGNSQFIGDNRICTLDDQFNNATHCKMENITNVFNLYGFYNITPFFGADTSGYGATLFVQGGVDIWRQLRVLEGILSFGSFDLQLQGNDASFINGSIHIQTPTTFVSGFEYGDAFTSLTASFPASLDPFDNDQADTGNWLITNSPLCDDDLCARATGAGTGTVSMTASFSTTNVNESGLTFVYSVVGLIGLGEFTMTISNSSDSEEVFQDATADVTLSSENVAISSVWDNQTQLNLTVTCDVTSALKPLRECYVDTIKINGSFTDNTTATVNGFDSQICFSDGTKDVNGICSRGIFYNASADITFINGPTNVTGGGGSGIGGSGTANTMAKWTASTTLGNSNILDSGSSITFNSDTTSPNTMSAADFRGLMEGLNITNINKGLSNLNFSVGVLNTTTINDNNSQSNQINNLNFTITNFEDRYWVVDQNTNTTADVVFNTMNASNINITNVNNTLGGIHLNKYNGTHYAIFGD